MTQKKGFLRLQDQLAPEMAGLDEHDRSSFSKLLDDHYRERIGDPGEFPFARGIHPTMYRGKKPTIRQFAGHGLATDTNDRRRQFVALVGKWRRSDDDVLDRLLIVAMLVLVASLLEVFMILPAHVAEWGKSENKEGRRHNWFDPLRKRYVRILKHTVRWRYAVVFGVLGIGVVACIAAFLALDKELFPGEEFPQFYIKAEMPASFGIKGMRIKNPEDLAVSIKEMLEYDGPVIVDVCVEKLENVYPMIPAGSAHNEMKFSDEDNKPAQTKEGMALV